MNSFSTCLNMYMVHSNTKMTGRKVMASSLSVIEQVGLGNVGRWRPMY